MAQQPRAKRICTRRSATTTITPDTKSQPALLRLPRELRDNIYEYYVSADGGYIYDPDKDCLKQADGSPISLSLARVNHQLRSELAGLPFQLNGITFTSAFSEANRESAAIHECLVSWVMSEKLFVVQTMLSELLTSEMAQTIATAYPRFAPFVDEWTPGSHDDHIRLSAMEGSFGEARSIWNDFIHCVYVQLIGHIDFGFKASGEEDYYLDIFHGEDFDMRRALALGRHHPDPWTILNDIEMKKLALINRFKHKVPYYRPHMRYGYSAAALALRFLNSLPQQTRQSVRNVTLVEDRETVASPACHGRGFIALCQENPNLRIRRFANLWKCVFSVGNYSREMWIPYLAKGHGSSSVGYLQNELQVEDITQSVGEWLTEASILPSLGMPEGSYTLILDGGPIPEYTSDVFQFVHRDVAYQQAVDMAYASGDLYTPSWIDRRWYGLYHFEQLAEIVGNISRNSQLIQCNFDPGSPRDPVPIFERNRGSGQREWRRNYHRIPLEIQTPAPLPPWHELRYDNILDAEGRDISFEFYFR